MPSRTAGKARSRLSRSAAPRLAALLGGVVVGWVYEDARGRLAFRYEEAWQDGPEAYPLSWSMPLAAQEHGDRATRAYLWGLLPDSEAVLMAWARRFGTSPLRAVDLLAHVGEDCAGAVQLARPERVDALQGEATAADETTSVTWLTEADVAGRLRELRTHPGLGRLAGDTGQFSLPGAQPKTALYEAADGRWGVPVGRMPTNQERRERGTHVGRRRDDRIDRTVQRHCRFPAVADRNGVDGARRSDMGHREVRVVPGGRTRVRFRVTRGGEQRRGRLRGHPASAAPRAAHAA